MKESTVFRGVSGLNNKIDPLRHRYSTETGIGELAEAVNCDIDDSGMISRRSGQTEISAGTFLTAYCNKGDCFVVMDRDDDSAIYQLGVDYSTLTGIRSGLTKGAMVSFWRHW